MGAAGQLARAETYPYNRSRFLILDLGTLESSSAGKPRHSQIESVGKSAFSATVDEVKHEKN
jgi:hypothetical protein